MAKSKDTQAAAPEETTVPVLEKNKQPGAVEAAPDYGPYDEEEEEELKELEERKKLRGPEAPTLFSLEELAEAKRVPGWQSAALHKLMGWEPGKRVSETEYVEALARLKGRRLGG